MKVVWMCKSEIQLDEILNFYSKRNRNNIFRKSITKQFVAAERYGLKDTEGREKFRDRAYLYYFGEIIRNRRKELNLRQEELAEVVGPNIRA